MGDGEPDRLAEGAAIGTPALRISACAAGWEGQHFNNDTQRGLYALDYASILHNIGRNDLAVILAEEACKNLEKDPKNLQIARNALTYYSKLAKIAPAISLPDLKK